MKRDMALVEKILTIMEDSSRDFIRSNDVDVGDPDKVIYHLKILKNAGYIGYDASSNAAWLTWAGHDYLFTLKKRSTAKAKTGGASL